MSVLLLDTDTNVTGEWVKFNSGRTPDYVGEIMLAVTGALDGGSITLEGGIADRNGDIITGTNAPIKDAVGATLTLTATGYYYIPIAQLNAIRAISASVGVSGDIQVYIS